MKNIKFNIRLILFGVFSLAAFTACDEDGYADYNAGGTTTQTMNGEFWIDIADADGNVYIEHALHKLYDNKGTLMISDRKSGADATSTDPNDFTGWMIESRLDYNLSDLTFNVSDADNVADGSVVTITEGKILKGAGHSKSGGVTDSIYFKAVFDYDPGTVLTFAGTRRTGFEEDEY